MAIADVQNVIADLAVAVLGRSDVTQDPHSLLLEGLLGPLNADVLTLNEIRPAAGTASVLALGPAWALSVAPESEPLTALLCAHPLVQHYANTRSQRPLAVTDVVPTRAWRACGTATMLREVLGVREQLAIPLPAPTGTARAWVAMRDTTAFDERARLLAAQLRPLLHAVDVHQQAVQRALTPRTSPGDSPPAATSGLTARELAILQLLCDGLTAVAIGRRLGISPRTVSKHLERVYRKLDVTDRLTAVLVAREQRLVQDDRPSTDGGIVASSDRSLTLAN